MDLNDDKGGAGETGTAEDLLGGGAGAGGEGGGADEGAGGGDEGGASDDFLAQFSTETGEGESASMQDWIKATGISDVAGLAKIARDNQRALRDSGRIKVPGEGATEQEIAEYRSAIGVPEKPEDYARPEPKGADGNPIPLNSAMTDRIFAAAHKLGVPKDIAEQLVAGEVEQQIAEGDAFIADLEKAAADHVAGWGNDRDAKLKQVNAALKDLGLSREDVAHMRAMPSGPGKFLDAMAKVGTNFSEDSLVKGDTKQFGISPADAQAELDLMKADPDIAAKILVPGSAEKKKWDRLQAAAGAA